MAAGGALGRTEMLRQMLLREPDLSIRNRFGGNALLPACERRHVETVRLLLTTRIDVDHVNNFGWTRLLEIVILVDGGSHHIEVTKLVLAAGVNPNLRHAPPCPCQAQRPQEIARLTAAAAGR